MDVQLSDNTLHVIFCGGVRDIKTMRNFLVRKPLHYQFKYFDLSCGEMRRRAIQQFRRLAGSAGMNRADSLEQVFVPYIFGEICSNAFRKCAADILVAFIGTKLL